jgi:hypothetical protein
MSFVTYIRKPLKEIATLPFQGQGVLVMVEDLPGNPLCDWSGAGYTVPLTSAQSTALSTALPTATVNRSLVVNRAAGISRSVLATFVTNVATAGGVFGTDLTQSTLDKITPWVDFIMRSTAWPKIRELWVPISDTSSAAGLAASTVKLKYPSGAATALTNTGPFVAGDYTPTGGLICASAVGKRLVSDFNPSVQFASQGEVGFATYCFGSGSRGTKNPDTAGAAALNTPYTGHVANVGGSNANSNYFTQNFASKLARISGTSIGNGVSNGVDLQYALGQGRFCAVQQTGGVGQSWRGAYLQATMPNASPSGNNSVYAVGGAAGTNEFTGSIGGIAFFDPLTQSEMGDLADFFDGINIAMNRQVFFNEVCTLGDSNTFVYGNGTTPPVSPNRWSRTIADQYGMAENNQGYPGARIYKLDGQIGLPSMYLARMGCASSLINILAPGYNDVANSFNYPINSALADYEVAVANLKLARTPNIMLLGCGLNSWAVGAANYPGTPTADVRHSQTEIPAWNAAVAAMAARQGVGYFDISTVPNVLQSDGIHNASSCQAAIGAAVAAAIRAQLL